MPSHATRSAARRRHLLFCAAVSAIALATGTAQAALLPALNFTSSNSNGTGTTSTRGYVFDVTAPVYVAGLSIYDANANGLADARDVGLWNSSGTLLASLSLDSGTLDPLDASGKFRYKLLNSILTLSVGTGYRVGAVFQAGSGDAQAVNMAGVSTAAGISYVTGAFVNNGVNSLTFPSTDFANGLPGGSLVLTDVPPPLPEPGTLALLAAGGIIGFARRRT